MMKNTQTALYVLVIILFFACKKDNVETEITNVSTAYKSFMVEHTATWCPPCGSVAFNTFEEIYKNNPYNLCGISLHPGDAVADGDENGFSELTSFYRFNATPQFAIDTFKASGFYSYTPTPQVQSNIEPGKIKKAKAGVGIAKKIIGNKLEINTKTVFFEDVTGSYNLAIYITEDGLQANQVNHTPTEVLHNNVFKGAVGGSFGKNIVTSAAKGQVIDGAYSFEISSKIKKAANLHVVAVIWKMNGTKAIEMINSNKE